MITIRSGLYKNRKLEIPETGVRPTADKIRQAIFNVLMHAEFSPNLNGAKVLDAFAGTGALGLEALSRGAAHAWFMEKHPGTFKILSQNLEIAADTASILLADATTPSKTPDVMDIVFLDPPYEKNLLAPAITALAAKGWIGDETLLVIETAKGEAWDKPDGLNVVDTRHYGMTEINFATFSRK